MAPYECSGLRYELSLEEEVQTYSCFFHFTSHSLFQMTNKIVQESM